MSVSAEDAKRVFILLNYGVMSGADVIKWAEGRVASSNAPSESLLELAWLSPNATSDIISRLTELARPADVYEAFKKVLASLHSYVVSHPSDAERISHRLLGTLVEIQQDTRAREFYFLYRCDDDFERVYQGNYAERDTVLKNFIDELKKFT